MENHKKFELQVMQNDLIRNRVPLHFYLSNCLKHENKSKLRACIKLGHVAVNGQQCTQVSLWLRSGDIVSCDIPANLTPSAIVAQEADLDILFEDEDLIVLNKQAGMSIHGGMASKDPTLMGALLHRFQVDTQEQIQQSGLIGEDEDIDKAKEEPVAVRDKVYPRIVHRLDKGTTGLMVVAKRYIAAKQLIQQFKQHKIRRSYLSLLVGCPRRPKGRITTRIGVHPKVADKMCTYAMNRREGKEAFSQFYLNEELADKCGSLVEWQLGSGRRHQIRVHAEYMGYPLLGDDRYGDYEKSIRKMSQGRKERKDIILQVLRMLHRPALHSQTLQFEHPSRQEIITFQKEPPPDFQKALHLLRNIHNAKELNSDLSLQQDDNIIYMAPVA